MNFEEYEEFDLRYFWLIGATFILAIVLFAVGGRANVNRRQNINAFIIDNISPEEHAWNGIIVGETTEEEAAKLVRRLDFVQKSSIRTTATDHHTYLNWGWITSPNNVNSSIRFVDGTVDGIVLSFATELTVESIIPEFGFPDEVYVSTVGTEPEYRFWAITLYYLAEGINIETYSRQLQKTFSFTDEVESIELFKPERITTAQELVDAYDLDIQDISDILPSWIPTKDKQLFESYLALFRQTEKIPYGPDGIFETSGLELGLFIAERQVKILRDGTTFDSDGMLIECPSETYGCTFRTSFDPNRNNHVFINGLQAATVGFHAGTVAHETFHLTLPFDTMQNSLYEEMTAIMINYSVSDGENIDRYTIAPPSDITSSYSRAEIADYFITYCGQTCSYFYLPTYPDTWEAILEKAE